MTSANVTIGPTPDRIDVLESRGNSQRTYLDYLDLDKALATDDLRSARQAFARLQEDSPPIAAALSQDPFPTKNPHLLALKELGRHLLSGNLRRAKQAFQRFN